MSHVTRTQAFVVVIPKEGLAGTNSAKTSSSMTSTTELYFVVFIDYHIMGVIKKKKAWLGWCQSCLLFGMTTTKILEPVLALCGFNKNCPLSSHGTLLTHNLWMLLVGGRLEKLHGLSF